MARFSFEIDLGSSYGTTFSYGPKAMELWRKYEASNSDDDFDELATYLADDIADDIDFTIVDIKLVSD